MYDRNKKSLPITISKSIRILMQKARYHKKLTHEELAKKSGLPTITISDIEKGIIIAYNKYVMKKLSNILGTKLW